MHGVIVHTKKYRLIFETVFFVLYVGPLDSCIILYNLMVKSFMDIVKMVALD